MHYLISCLGGRYHYPHFTEEETGSKQHAQRLHRSKVIELLFESRYSLLKPLPYPGGRVGKGFSCRAHLSPESGMAESGLF